jgi:hypothetical protein
VKIPFRAEGTENFVGTHVVEEYILPALPHISENIEQDKRTVDIAPYKIGRSLNRSVHMTLRSKMHNRINPELFDDIPAFFKIGNIRLPEMIPFSAEIFFNIRQAHQISGIGEFIQIYYINIVRIIKKVSYEIRSDKACAACYQNIFRFSQ